MHVNVEQVPLFLAPMAGVTDLAYRLLARECGADVTVTEFTAASGLTRRNTYSWLKVETDFWWRYRRDGKNRGNAT